MRWPLLLRFKFFLLTIMLINCNVLAQVSDYLTPAQKIARDRQITQWYQSLNLPNTQEQRLYYFSQQLLNKPYLVDALGEGASGRFDQRPRYRLDQFDCITLVSTVLALAEANNLADFQQHLAVISYEHGEINYITRHHFVSVDWNPTLQQLHLLQDITPTLHDSQGRPLAKIARAMIDKPQWYQHRQLNNIDLRHAPAALLAARLTELRNLGRQTHAQLSQLPYVPLSALLHDGKVSAFILQQLPNASVVEFVAPNWDLTQKLGTHLNIAHLGLLLRHEGKLWLFEASSARHFGRGTVQILFSDYLRYHALKGGHIRGIHVEKIL